MIPVQERVFRFACDVAIAARLFTLEQIARHPDISWRSQPVKRASEFLRDYSEWFDKMPGPHGKPFRWRLSTKAKRRLGVRYASVNGTSQKAEHWLGLGDIWMTLTFAGGRPSEWCVERDQVFDAYFVWQGVPYLLEYQRTPLSSTKWQAKWKQRIEWYKAQKWQQPPRVVLVNTTGQQENTIHLPRNTIHVRDISLLHHALAPSHL